MLVFFSSLFFSFLLFSSLFFSFLLFSSLFFSSRLVATLPLLFFSLSSRPLSSRPLSSRPFSSLSTLRPHSDLRTTTHSTYSSGIYLKIADYARSLQEYDGQDHALLVDCSFAGSWIADISVAISFSPSWRFQISSQSSYEFL
ncbi:hypothetical protein GQ43DRAFT_444877 [Delitschia confertaspora ATCC 74209]|uniref:Uncharacterized protein n=1 Tax=Delitschia confertaspora ATCC 74209 TaxID=1513339 RepID=A0A9P4JE99_9PLEO|nr:hypothetical protein GQ43DRAFT_444877 [Delitschia confertaspora ATCC 74209]